MTPGWQNVRIGLANSYEARKTQFDAWKRPHFWYLLGLSIALWALIAVVLFG